MISLPFSIMTDLEFRYFVQLKPRVSPEDCPHPWWIVTPPVKKVCAYCGLEKPFNANASHT